MLNLLILTEAGRGIGLGHYLRCKAIQSHIKKNNGNVKVLVYKSGNMYSLMQNANTSEHNWLINIEDILRYKNKYDMLLVDSYLARARHYSFLSSVFNKVAVLDDYNRLSYRADLLINPNLFGDSVDYTNQSARVVGGAKYIILSEVVIKKRNSYRLRTNVRNVLITFGGDYNKKLISNLIKGISWEGLKVTVVSPSSEIGKRAHKRSNFRVYGHRSSRMMAELILGSDIVISAAGQTLGELAYLGIPTVSICLGSDQTENINIYHKKGFLPEVLHKNDNCLVKKIANNLELLKSYDYRKQISRIGKKLVGKDGIRNVIKSMESLNG